MCVFVFYRLKSGRGNVHLHKARPSSCRQRRNEKRSMQLQVPENGNIDWDDDAAGRYTLSIKSTIVFHFSLGTAILFHCRYSTAINHLVPFHDHTHRTCAAASMASLFFLLSLDAPNWLQPVLKDGQLWWGKAQWLWAIARRVMYTCTKPTPVAWWFHWFFSLFIFFFPRFCFLFCYYAKTNCRHLCVFLSLLVYLLIWLILSKGKVIRLLPRGLICRTIPRVLTYYIASRSLRRIYFVGR